MTRGIKSVDLKSGRTSEENTVVEVLTDLTSVTDAIERFEIKDDGAHHVESFKTNHERFEGTELEVGPTEAAVRAVITNSTADVVHARGVKAAELVIHQ